MLLGRIGTPRLKMATAIVTRRELARLLANRRYCNHYYAPSFRGFRHKANTLERNSFQDQFPRAPILLPFRHPRFPLLDLNDSVAEAVEAYIANHVMPNDPGGDALHLAVASFHRCDFLVTWNCRHIANANKFGHIRRVNGILGLGNPTLVTPLELLNEDIT